MSIVSFIIDPHTIVGAVGGCVLSALVPAVAKFFTKQTASAKAVVVAVEQKAVAEVDKVTKT
jgi:hypothetical protein